MTPTHSRLLVVAAAVAVALSFATIPAAAQGNSDPNGNTGTVKVHDGSSADPPQQNEPQVEGDVFVEGFNFAAEEGTLNFFEIPPTGDGELVLATTWEADGSEPENHFLEGPFVFPCGHYRVEAQNGMEEDDFPGGVKSKSFWVVGCEAEEPDECGEPGMPPCPEPVVMECPTGFSVESTPEGNLLTFTPAEGSDGTNIYRAVGDGDFEYITTVDADVTEYLDEDVLPDEAYAYTVTGLYGDESSTDCAVVESSAIPVFPTALAGGLAIGLSVLAYVGFAARRKD